LVSNYGQSFCWWWWAWYAFGTASSDLFEALKTARSEAENAFGSGELILKKQ
jgi:hypothetical protein